MTSLSDDMLLKRPSLLALRQVYFYVRFRGGVKIIALNSRRGFSTLMRFVFPAFPKTPAK